MPATPSAARVWTYSSLVVGSHAQSWADAYAPVLPHGSDLCMVGGCSIESGDINRIGGEWAEGQTDTECGSIVHRPPQGSSLRREVREFARAVRRRLWCAAHPTLSYRPSATVNCGRPHFLLEGGAWRGVCSHAVNLARVGTGHWIMRAVDPNQQLVHPDVVAVPCPVTVTVPALEAAQQPPPPQREAAAAKEDEQQASTAEQPGVASPSAAGTKRRHDGSRSDSSGAEQSARRSSRARKPPTHYE